MLNQLISKRNEQLNQVNELMSNVDSSSNHKAKLDELEALAKTIKSNYDGFALSLVPVYDTIFK